MAKGLHRGRVKVGNHWRSAGSYKVDIRTKSVGRIVKHSGVFPNSKNPTEYLRQIKIMLKELDVARDKKKLTQIKDGKVGLLDALSAWQSGRLTFAEAYGSESLKARLERWIPVSAGSPMTRQQWNEYFKRLIKLKFLDDDTLVREVPDVLRRLRGLFESDKKAVSFNHYRTMFLSFLQKDLGYDEDSHVLQQTRRVKKLEITNLREHHPLENPHDLLELGERINTRGRWNRREVDYRSWIWFMALHGLRPEEFANGHWLRDPKTGHIRITGTKTKNAIRVVPSITWLKPEPRSLKNLQMRLYFLTPATAVRARDFRRTASLWWEAAGIPRSRYRYYMGHGAVEMTDRYQVRSLTEAVLNEDKQRLETWLSSKLDNPAAKTKRVWSPATKNFLASLLDRKNSARVTS
jgi:hypothetical protein